MKTQQEVFDEFKTDNLMVVRQKLLARGMKNCKVNRFLHNLQLIAEGNGDLHEINQLDYSIYIQRDSDDRIYYAIG